MRMMRCLVNHVAFTMRDGRTEEFQKDMEINFDRVINAETGFTVGQAFEGRENYFEPVDAEHPADFRRPATLLDLGRALNIDMNPAPTGEGE